jgi:hypothetical protein
VNGDGRRVMEGAELLLQRRGRREHF